MKQALLFFGIVALIASASLLSTMMYPIEDALFCPGEGSSVSAGLSGISFMVMAGGTTLIGGSIYVFFTVRRSIRQQLSQPKILLNTFLIMLWFPIACSVIAAIQLYHYCPGFGRSLTPDQKSAIKHGYIPNHKKHEVACNSFIQEVTEEKRQPTNRVVR